jgi:hypothetical protein
MRIFQLNRPFVIGFLQKFCHNALFIKVNLQFTNIDATYPVNMQSLMAQFMLSLNGFIIDSIVLSQVNLFRRKYGKNLYGALDQSRNSSGIKESHREKKG